MDEPSVWGQLLDVMIGSVGSEMVFRLMGLTAGGVALPRAAARWLSWSPCGFGGWRARARILEQGAAWR